MTGFTVLSYGGGVQSTALLVLAGQGRIDIDAALFANVGDDSEHPDTLAYVRDIATPWAAAHGIPVHEIRRPGPTLAGDLTGPGRSIRIPVRMANGAPGNRSCSQMWKTSVADQWLRTHGATASQQATVLIGFSADETHRIGRRRWPAHANPTYPLVDAGLTRQGCRDLIAHAGLPVPPKSSCYFCPYKTRPEWETMARDRPDLFAQAEAVEAAVIARRAELGKDPAYLPRYGRPLAQAITEAQATLPGLEGIGEQGCDEGVCFV